MLVPLRLSGVNEDQPPWLVPPEIWTGVTGINFRDQVATRVLGAQYQYGDPIGAPLHVLNSDFDGTNYWLYGGDDFIGVVDTANNHFDLTPPGFAAGGESADWTSTILNGIPLLNPSDGFPRWWDRNTANVVQALPGWDSANDAKTGSLRVFKDFIFAIGYTDNNNTFPDQLRWSDAADPGLLPTEWVATAENLAGSLEFGDTPGGLVDGLPLRGSFVVYKTGATYLMTFIGGRFLFRKQRLFTTSGVLAKNCVAEVEGNHIVMTDSDIIIHDGNQAKSLVDSQTRREVFANIDPDNYQRSFVFNFKSRDEVWCCYPEIGRKYPNKCLVWDKDGNLLGFRDLIGGPEGQDGLPHIGYGNISSAGTPRPWEDQNYAWDTADYAWNSGQSNVAIFGGVAADVAAIKLQGVDLGGTVPAGSLQSGLERHSLDFGAADKVKLCQRVWPRIEGTTGDIVNIRVGSQFDTDAMINWGPTVPFTIGVDRKTDHAVQGRYLSFEFSATDGDIYRMTGFDVELSETGGMF